MKRKLLAGVLSLCMIFSLIPVGAFAAFDDTNGHWGAASAERWSQVGVLNGDDTGNFNPDKQMTRAEFAQMLCNLMGYTEKAPNNFSDVPNDAWYADAILKLVAAGVMNGVSDTSAAPQAPITREQAAVLLCRAMNITPSANASVTFSDAGSVSSWAKDAVAALTERGMINGVGNNNFAPANNIVRAAVAQMVDNMVAEYVTQSGATVTGEVKGVVIIKADNVKIEDATLAENVIVAPAAENATVTLTGSTQAAGVVVGAEGAKVVVDSTATAESVTVDAPKAQTEIAGKVDTVAVTENAESAKTTVAKAAEVKTVTVDAPKAETQVSGKVDTVAVAQNAESAKTTVAKDAEVTNVTVAAPKADTSISGTVSKVDVAQSATGANVTANAGAKVDSVTTAANDVKVNGADNTIGTVTTTGGTADVTSKGTEVKNEGADKVTVDGNKDVPKGDSTTSDKTPTTPSGGGSGGGGGGGNQPQTNDRVVDAIFHDTRTAQGTTVADSALKAGYSVTDKTVDGDTTKVTINHQNIWQHQNAQPEPVLGYWTGFAVKAPADVVAGQVKYKTGATKAEVGTGLASVALKDVDQSGSANGLAFYFNMANNETKAEKWIAIQWKDDSAIEYYQVNFANTSMKPEVENVKLQVVENLGDVKKLPTEVQTVLCLDDFLSQTNNNAATDDMPWLVVTYKRNVAAAVTFNVTKGSDSLSGMTDKTSAATINANACQSWSMNPQTESSGKLWDSNPEIISGTYKITLTVEGKTFTSDALVYEKTGEDIFTVTFDSNGGSAVDPQVIKKGETATTPTPAPTQAGKIFEGWYTKEANGEFASSAYNFSTAVNADITLYAKWREPTQYNVTVTSPTAGTGTVTTSATGNKAAEGAEVTITATPAAGYTVGTIAVKDADNGNITVTSGKFTMPAKNVTVTVTFVKEVIAAPLGTNTMANPAGDLATGYTATLSGTTVTVTANNLKRHTATGNATPKTGYFVGVGIKVTADNEAAVKAMKFDTGWGAAPSSITTFSTAPDNVVKDGDTYYATFYFNIANAYKDENGAFATEAVNRQGVVDGHVVGYVAMDGKTYTLNFDGVKLADPTVELQYGATVEEANTKWTTLADKLHFSNTNPPTGEDACDKATLLIGINNTNPLTDYTLTVTIDDVEMKCNKALKTGNQPNGAGIVYLTLDPTDIADDGTYLYTGATELTETKDAYHLDSTATHTVKVTLNDGTKTVEATCDIPAATSSGGGSGQ